MTHNDLQTSLITAKRPSLAERICEYIYSCDIPQLAILDETLLAEIFNIPRENMCKRFEKKMGKSLETFVNEHKLYNIQLSIYERTCTEKNLKELSRKLGFSNYREFKKRFYKWLGITPKKLIEITGERYKEWLRDIILLCMYLNSWEEEEPQKSGTMFRKAWYNYNYDNVGLLETFGWIRKYPRFIKFTEYGITRAEELAKKYFNGLIMN